MFENSLRAICVALIAALCALFATPATAQVAGCGEISAFCFADQDDCPCGNDYELGGCANLTGEGGILQVTGSGVVAADDLVLTAVQLPEGMPTVFFAGQADARTPFRNGLLCMDPSASKLLRLFATQVVGDGTAQVGPGIIDYLQTEFPPNVGTVSPGSTWYFQAYYRDPGHCVSSANLTNAVRVIFASEPPAGSTRIGGRVFYDWNESAVYEVGGINEDVIEGWKVTLDGPGGPYETFTDALGRFEFLVPTDGALYTMTSHAPDPGYIPIAGSVWLPTGPVSIDVVADGADRCAEFGQIAFVNTPELARPPQFWCGDEGRAFLEGCDPEWRDLVNDLCLRTNVTNPNGEEGTFFSVPLAGEPCEPDQCCDDDCEDDAHHNGNGQGHHQHGNGNGNGHHPGCCCCCGCDDDEGDGEYDDANANGNGNGNGNGHGNHHECCCDSDDDDDANGNGSGNGHGHGHHPGCCCEDECVDDGGFAQAAADLCDFLSAPTNGVLANQLSQQFVTAVLNYRCGELQNTIYVDRNQDGVLLSLDELIELTRELLCMPCSANTGPGGDEVCRMLIEGCLQEWDDMNSDGERIFSKSERKRDFATPY
jgi:hypothetical protein